MIYIGLFAVRARQDKLTCEPIGSLLIYIGRIICSEEGEAGQLKV